MRLVKVTERLLVVNALMELIKLLLDFSVKNQIQQLNF